MPRFFFDVRDGHETVDEDGLEFPDIEAAELEALTAAAAMAKDRFSHGPGTLSVEVRDDSGIRRTIVVTTTVVRS